MREVHQPRVGDQGAEQEDLHHHPGVERHVPAEQPVQPRRRRPHVQAQDHGGQQHELQPGHHHQHQEDQPRQPPEPVLGKGEDPRIHEAHPLPPQQVQAQEGHGEDHRVEDDAGQGQGHRGGEGVHPVTPQHPGAAGAAGLHPGAEGGQAQVQPAIRAFVEACGHPRAARSMEPSGARHAERGMAPAHAVRVGRARGGSSGCMGECRSG